MSSPPNTIARFKGMDWKECNEFILAVRAVAWKEGKLRDLAWMADFASLHFSHQALLWHAQLPQDVRQNWMKLEVALLNRWTPPKYGDEPQIEPTPAAAPFINGSTNAGRPRQGVLKLVSEKFGGSYYVTLEDEDIICRVTSDLKKALRVGCNRSSGATLLERMDGSQHSWLGIYWERSDPNLENGSVDACDLVLVDSYGLRGPCSFQNPWQHLTCTISTNGEVIPVWKTDAVGTRKVTLGAICSTNSISLVPDPRSALRFSNWDTAKIIFEPIH